MDEKIKLEGLNIAKFIKFWLDDHDKSRIAKSINLDNRPYWKYTLEQAGYIKDGFFIFEDLKLKVVEGEANEKKRQNRGGEGWTSKENEKKIKDAEDD